MCLFAISIDLTAVSKQHTSVQQQFTFAFK